MVKTYYEVMKYFDTYPDEVIFSTEDKDEAYHKCNYMIDTVGKFKPRTTYRVLEKQIEVKDDEINKRS